MKLKFIYILCLSVFAYVVLSSRSSGAAAAGLGNRTGSPGSSGLCSGCHSGASYTTNVSIALKDGSNNSVTQYRPGQAYTLEYTITASGGTPTGYGMQSVIFRSNNTNAGTLGTALTPNTRITSSTYVEHNGVSSTGVFRATWTAPAAGTGNVTVYAVGLGVNNNGNTNGDKSSSTVQLAIAEDITAINYSQTSYCTNGTNPSPTITGTTGGSFSAPAGLSVNSGTGVLNLATSTPGTYTVTYTYGSGSTVTDQVTITAADVATMNYANASYCQNGSDVSPSTTGAGGAFSATPVGLSINATSGLIDVSASAAGNYTVNYVTNGVCPTTVSDAVTITPADVANINYANAIYCKDAANPSPTLTGSTGGTYSASPAGLSISASTGLVDVAASAVGSYTVSYTTVGACPNTVTDNISIVDLDVASIDYVITSYCPSDTDPQPTITGAQGGSFSAAPSGLAVIANTGGIDLSASSAGNYIVTYTTTGQCPVTATDNITVIASDIADFSYTSATFCTTNSNPSPTLVGTTGGIFASSPAGLSLSASTGEVDIASSALGTYTVEYQTFGTCPDTFNTSFTLTGVGDASFSYANDSLCAGAGTAPAIITGIAGGAFASSPAGLVFSDTMGTIDIANSVLDIYEIIYSVSGGCAAQDTFYVTLLPQGIADINYALNAYCPVDSVLVPLNISSGNVSFNPAGLVFIDQQAGIVDLANSTQSTVYVVSVRTNEFCAGEASDTFRINHQTDASFNYPSVFYCVDFENNAVANITGSGGGTFSAPGLSINPNTGEIDFSLLPTGTFTIEYIIAADCPDTATFELILDVCSSIEDVTDVPANFHVYPNPNQGNFMLHHTAASSGELNLWVTDVLGAQIYRQSVLLSQNEVLPIAIPKANSGIYFLHIKTTDGSIYTTKIRVE